MNSASIVGTNPVTMTSPQDGSLTPRTSARADAQDIRARVCAKVVQSLRAHRTDAAVVALLAGLMLYLYFYSTQEIKEAIGELGRANHPMIIFLIGAARGCLAVWIPAALGTSAELHNSRDRERRRLEASAQTRHGFSGVDSNSQTPSGADAGAADLLALIPLVKRLKPAPLLAYLSLFNIACFGPFALAVFVSVQTMEAIFGPTADPVTGDIRPGVLASKLAFDYGLARPTVWVPWNGLGLMWRSTLPCFCTLKVKRERIFGREQLLTGWYLPLLAQNVLTTVPIMVVMFMLPVDLQTPFNQLGCTCSF